MRRVEVRPCRCAVYVGAAVFSVLAIGGAEAQSVSREHHQDERVTFTVINPCNADEVTVDARTRVLNRTEPTNNGGFRSRTEIRQDGPGKGVPSFRDYDYDAFSFTEVRSSEPFFRFEVRQRERIRCEGNCRPSPDRDDFFMETRVRCEGTVDNQACRQEGTPEGGVCR
jgi:hypothetical protein